MFEINQTYWLKVKSQDGDRVFSIKGKILEENTFMVKISMSHLDKPETIEIIPFIRILSVEKEKQQ